MGSEQIEVPSPNVAAPFGFETQAKSVRFESVGESALRTPSPFGFNPGDATETYGIGVFADYTDNCWTTL